MTAAELREREAVLALLRAVADDIRDHRQGVDAAAELARLARLIEAGRHRR